MPASIRLVLLVSLTTILTIGFPKSIGSQKGGEVAAPPSSDPTIQHLEPSNTTPWSYVVISGENLTNSDGTCSVLISDVDSYVADCSPSEIRAIVPWTGESGNVVVSADGIASNAVQITVAPLQVDSSDIVSGVISFKLRPTSEVGTVAARQGDPPQAAVAAGGPGDSHVAGWYALQVSPGSEVSKATSYSADPEVLYAGPIPLPKTNDVPNDPCYPSPRQPQCPAQSATGQWALPRIDAPTAWNYSKGDGVKIAVIDTGFETGHPDLNDHMTAGWNCNGGGDVSPLNSHGTAVAGVSAAETNNSDGIAGVAWNSLVQPLRFDVLVNGPPACPAVPVQEEFLIDKAVAEGASVINMSYSYDFPHPMCAWNCRGHGTPDWSS